MVEDRRRICKVFEVVVPDVYICFRRTWNFLKNDFSAVFFVLYVVEIWTCNFGLLICWYCCFFNLFSRLRYRLLLWEVLIGVGMMNLNRLFIPGSGIFGDDVTYRFQFRLAAWLVIWIGVFVVGSAVDYFSFRGCWTSHGAAHILLHSYVLSYLQRVQGLNKGWLSSEHLFTFTDFC